MRRHIASVLSALLLWSCAADPNEGVFVLNGLTLPKLTDERLAEIRKTWTPSSQPKSESTKAGRYASYWILDLIAHTELADEVTCTTIELIAIQPREVDLMIQRPSPTGQVYFFRAATYHEAWIVSVCGKKREWRILDDAANPQNPLRAFRWSDA